MKGQEKCVYQTCTPYKLVLAKRDSFLEGSDVSLNIINKQPIIGKIDLRTRMAEHIISIATSVC